MARPSPTPAALADELLRALVAGDQVQAELVALDAVAGGMPLADLYADVLAPALNEVGRRWQAGDLTVADEHLATAVVEGVMARVGRAATRLPRRSRERVLLACAEDEGHVVALRMVADLAEGAGFDVRYLGASVPVDALVDLARRLRPRVVGLSASAGAAPAAVIEAVDGLLALPGLDVIVGGDGVPAALGGRERVHRAGDVREALTLLEALADSAPAAGG